MYPEFAIKKRNKHPNNIDLCRKIRKGIVASSPNFHWSVKNITKSSTNPINKSVIVEDFHGCFMPPHCNARKRQQIEAIRAPAPKGSNCCNLYSKVVGWRFSFSSLIRRKIRIRTNATKPMGIFLGS